MSERQASQKSSPAAKDGTAASSEADAAATRAAGARAVNLDYGSIGATTKKTDEPTLVVVAFDLRIAQSVQDEKLGLSPNRGRAVSYSVCE